MLQHALFYHRVWDVNVVFTSPTRLPASSWGEAARRRLAPQELADMYSEALRRFDSVMIAVATGPYQEPPYHIVIDVDDPGTSDRSEVEALERAFAREGLVVVSTPRGFHLHAKTGDSVYMLSLSTERAGKRVKTGDGASLQPHLWTVPPSKRLLKSSFWYTYHFVLPSGKRLYTTSVTREELKPQSYSFSELRELVEELLGYEVHVYRPGDEAPRRPPVEREGFYYKPIFNDLVEFHAKALHAPLPAPVAIILYNYYMGTGLESLAQDVLARNFMYFTEFRRVPRGTRFLASAEFALFMAHLVAFIRFDDIVEMLSYGVEDWPVDDGAPLDRKVRYLLLFDEEGRGYVMPRYSGLGGMTPQLMCGRCFYRGSCARSRMPWLWYSRFISGLEVKRGGGVE